MRVFFVCVEGGQFVCVCVCGCVCKQTVNNEEGDINREKKREIEAHIQTLNQRDSNHGRIERGKEKGGKRTND